MEDPVQPTNPNAQPVPTVPSVRKEAESAPAYITHSEPEPIIAPEVREAGVEAHTANELNLTRADLDAGLSHSPEALKPILDPVNAVYANSVPAMTQPQAVVAEKGSEEDSNTWYGAIWNKFYKVRQLFSLGGTKKVTA